MPLVKVKQIAMTSGVQGCAEIDLVEGGGEALFFGKSIIVVRLLSGKVIYSI